MTVALLAGTEREAREWCEINRTDFGSVVVTASVADCKGLDLGSIVKFDQYGTWFSLEKDVINAFSEARRNWDQAKIDRMRKDNNKKVGQEIRSEGYQVKPEDEA